MHRYHSHPLCIWASRSILALLHKQAKPMYVQSTVQFRTIDKALWLLFNGTSGCLWLVWHSHSCGNSSYTKSLEEVDQGFWSSRLFILKGNLPDKTDFLDFFCDILSRVCLQLVDDSVSKTDWHSIPLHWWDPGHYLYGDSLSVTNHGHNECQLQKLLISS